jgi:Tfp pilus assembly protein PilO
MKLTDRDRRVVVLGLVIALGIVGYLFVVSPMQLRWKKVTQGLKASRAELDKLERVAKEGRYYAERRQEVARRVIETPDLEASQRVIPVLINEVEDCGHRRRIQIMRYDPLPPKVEGSYAVYSVSLNLQADLGPLVEFLKDLGEARPVMNIKRLHITPPDPTAKVQKLSAELMLSTYVIASPGESAGPAKPAQTTGA